MQGCLGVVLGLVLVLVLFLSCSGDDGPSYNPYGETECSALYADALSDQSSTQEDSRAKWSVYCDG